MNVSSSHGPAQIGRVLLRRLLLLSASLTIGTVIWFLLGDSDGLVAEEKLLPAAHAAMTPPSEVIAHVDGVAITEEDVLIDVASELAELEEARRALLQEALESRIAEQLIDSEAFSRGMTPEELLEIEVEAKLDLVEAAQIEAQLEAVQAKVGQAEAHLGESLPGPSSQEAIDELRRELRLEAFVEQLRQAAAVSVYGKPAV